ncbi:hypothetical protein [Pediococcus pentosaceus]|uniref:hypothetical protein n=1 Tax=Pediococcus pentosaceus TaxID=1255 RepID=UPI00398213AA
MNKQKGQSVRDVIEVALCVFIILGAVGSFLIKLAKADYIRRMDPNNKKKKDQSNKD